MRRPARQAGRQAGTRKVSKYGLTLRQMSARAVAELSRTMLFQ